MEDNPKKSKIEPTHIEEAARLKALFKARSKMSQASFGAEYEIGSQGMVWQYLNAKSPLNLPAALSFARGLNCSVSDFSPRLASMLEVAQQHVGGADDEARESTNLVLAPAHKDEIVHIPVMNAEASMGLGLAMPEVEAVVDVLKLNKTWVHENLRGITAPRNLAVLSAYGDSMSPTLNDGDILLVDLGITEIKLDAIYVLALNNELYIKRIQRRITDGAIIIRSDNSQLYDPITVEHEQLEFLRVLGRIVWVWNGKKL